MRHALLLVLFVLAAASPAAAQSCATLGGGLNCGAAAAKPLPPAKSPPPPLPGQDAETHGYSESTVSNRGSSTTLNSHVIDSHGIVEFGFSGSTRMPCRHPGYGSPCE